MEENKKKFEVKVRKENNGDFKKAIFIDDELLDWSIDINSLANAIKNGPEFLAVIQKDIENHFIESVSDFLGRKVTIEEIQTAIRTGYI